MDFQKKRKISFLVGLTLIAAIVCLFVFLQERDGFLRIIFFDVGQGDAEFIETPDKKQILIDGGPNLSILEKLGRKMPFYDRYIDLIILSHPEADHLSGLIEVLKRYNVGAVITNGVVRDTEEYNQWINLLKEKRIPIFIAQSGGSINLGRGARFDVLYPLENLLGKEVSDSNNTSVVGKLVFGSFKALFTGDIEKSTENKLISSGLDLKSEILKVAHHGSKTSSSDEFLRAVDAVLAIIEVGADNRYGHPHQEVLEKLKNLQVFKTSENGDVEIFSDGFSFNVKK